jgi:hypothetical protein
MSTATPLQCNPSQVSSCNPGRGENPRYCRRMKTPLTITRRRTKRRSLTQGTTTGGAVRTGFCCFRWQDWCTRLCCRHAMSGWHISRRRRSPLTNVQAPPSRIVKSDVYQSDPNSRPPNDNGKPRKGCGDSRSILVVAWRARAQPVGVK